MKTAEIEPSSNYLQQVLSNIGKGQLLNEAGTGLRNLAQAVRDVVNNMLLGIAKDTGVTPFIV